MTKCMPERANGGSKLPPWVAIAVVDLAVLTVMLCSGCSAQPPPAAPKNAFRIEFPQTPDILPASTVRLDDDEEIIGVSLEGGDVQSAQHRAYVVRAFAPLNRAVTPTGGLQSPLAANGPQEVVNDVLGAVPITVVCLHSADHCQVLAPQNPPPPEWATSLGIQLIEATDQYLELQWSGTRFRSPGSPPDGLKAQPHIRTTWGDWRAKHPDTDVYLGSLYDD